MSIASWKNGRDRSREAERRAEEAARAKKAREADARLAETERALARLEGRREALLGVALADEGLREAERMRLAARRGEVTGRYVDGEPVLELRDGSTVTDDEVDTAIRAALGFADTGDGGQ